MSCVTRITALLMSALLVAAPVTGSLKIWGHQLSLDAASAWAGGRRPCSGQVALLGDSLAVYLHKQLEARSMILPSNGEVIFGEGASVSFVDTVAPGDDRCREAGVSPVRFGGAAARWFDANSWQQAAVPSPVPHSERVPCVSGGDSVLFPENITYRARVQRPVTVAALSVGPHTMTNDRFRAFRNSSTGRSLFDVRERFNISGVSRPCGAEECVCGNDRGEVLSVICGATKCPEAPCSGPIQPTGHCCPMCGAFVRVTSRGGRLQPAEVRRLIGGLGPDTARVRYHVSLTAARQLQTVLVDTAPEQTASGAVAKALLSRLKDSAQYGVSEPVLRVSGPRHAAMTGGGRSGSVAGPVLGALVCLIAAGLLVWAVTTKRVSMPSAASLRPPPPSEWHLRDRAASLAARLPRLRSRLASAAAAPFHFARFRNSTCGSEVELGQRAEELESVQDSASVCTAESGESTARAEESRQSPAQPDSGGAPPKAARSFDNPMFGNTKLDDNVPSALLAPTSAICVTPDGKAVENPFFGVPVISVAEGGGQASSEPTAPFTDLTPPEDREGEAAAAAGQDKTPATEPDQTPRAGRPETLTRGQEAPRTEEDGDGVTAAGGDGEGTSGRQQGDQREQKGEERELLIDVEDSD